MSQRNDYRTGEVHFVRWNFIYDRHVNELSSGKFACGNCFTDDSIFLTREKVIDHLHDRHEGEMLATAKNMGMI